MAATSGQTSLQAGRSARPSQGGRKRRGGSGYPVSRAPPVRPRSSRYPVPRCSAVGVAHHCTAPRSPAAGRVLSDTRPLRPVREAFFLLLGRSVRSYVCVRCPTRGGREHLRHQLAGPPGASLSSVVAPTQKPRSYCLRGVQTKTRGATRFSGAGARTRTGDLLITSEPLYQLSYTSKMERETGLEPATLCLGSRCSTTELLPRARQDTTRL